MVEPPLGLSVVQVNGEIEVTCSLCVRDVLTDAEVKSANAQLTGLAQSRERPEYRAAVESHLRGELKKAE